MKCGAPTPQHNFVLTHFVLSGDTLCIRVDVTSRRVYAAKNDADYELVALNLPTTGRLFPAVCLETGSSGAVRFNVSVYSAEPQTPK